MDLEQAVSDVVLVFVLECGADGNGCHAALDDITVNATHKCMGNYFCQTYFMVL